MHRCITRGKHVRKALPRGEAADAPGRAPPSPRRAAAGAGAAPLELEQSGLSKVRHCATAARFAGGDLGWPSASPLRRLLPLPPLPRWPDGCSLSSSAGEDKLAGNACKFPPCEHIHFMPSEGRGRTYPFWVPAKMRPCVRGDEPLQKAFDSSLMRGWVGVVRSSMAAASPVAACVHAADGVAQQLLKRTSSPYTYAHADATAVYQDVMSKDQDNADSSRQQDTLASWSAISCTPSGSRAEGRRCGGGCALTSAIRKAPRFPLPLMIW